MASTEMQMSSSGQDPFVLVDGPKPTEAEHIYDHFFSQYPSQGYSHDLIQSIHSRRSRPELEGILFFDQLLQLALQSDDAHAISSVEYPPATGKDGLVHLIERISCSAFDRNRRMALLYYLLLDLDAFNHTKFSEGAFIKAVALPQSVRYAMLGYWNLDNANYRVGVSYLEQPDFIPRILSILSPLALASFTAEEGRERAHAFLAFLKRIDTGDLESSENVRQAKIVSTCYTQGVWAAWLLCRESISLEGGEEEEEEMMVSVARIVEYCFMPKPKPSGVQALVALPLTSPEETLLGHVIVNPPPSIVMSASAHAKAIDALLVRHINSGHYVDAVLLNKRVNASLGLMHLTSDANDETERDRLRILRKRRQALVKAAYSVLTNVERTLLELGDSSSVTVEGAEEEDDSEASWERVPSADPKEHDGVKGDFSFLSEAGPSRMTPLTASPVLRKQAGGQDRTSDPLLAAIARSRITNNKGSPAGKSAIGSPVTHALSPAVADRSTTLRASIGSYRDTSSHITPGDVSISSPLARSKPYSLNVQAQEKPAEAAQLPFASFGGDSIMTIGDSSAVVEEEEAKRDVEESMGPMARLAEQLQVEMQRNRGTVDEILRKSSSSSNVSPFRIGFTPSKNAHSTLTFARAPRTFEARYELGEDKTDENVDEQEDEAMMTDDVPRRRQTRRSAPQARHRRTKVMARRPIDEHDDDGDTSIPGSFPGEEDVVDRNAGVASERDALTKKPTRAQKRKGGGGGRKKEGGEDVEGQEGADDVPEMIQASKVGRSRSAAAGLASRPKASTPLRRSSRLSVEPESRQAPEEAGEDDVRMDTRQQRATRSASPSKTGGGKKKSTAGKSGANVRTTRSTSQAPSEAKEGEEDAITSPIMTRSSSRRKGAASDSIPGAF